MRDIHPRIILCNGADLPQQWAQYEPLVLEYRELTDGISNVKLALPDFISSVSYLPPRILDLLEIAAYVFCADRLILRGNKANVEYHGWSRLLHFVIKVRDWDFWNTREVKEALKEALVFMSGDQTYHFTFQRGHLTPPADLFDQKTFQIKPQKNTKITLFSGGLDSLAGVVSDLENSVDQLCLVSHRSGQPTTAKTQDQLVKVIDQCYPNRIKHYGFYCSLQGIGRKEETQRTRAFLYMSIAYALAHALSQRKVFVYENGITSINFPTQESQINARSSRTTHPKVIALLENLFSVIEESTIEIATPFLWKTKTDIFHILDKFGQKDLISSAVSCSHTSRNDKLATHCGGCSQCIDRRFAAYSSNLDDVDDVGIYTSDFIRRGVESDEVKATLIDYVYQAKEFASRNLNDFYLQMFSELADFIDYIPGTSEQEKVKKVWELCHRHGKQMDAAIRRMQAIHDDPFLPLPEDSFLQMIAEREYLSDPIQEQQDQTIGSRSQPNGVELFYSYSHRDEELREQLENHLSILRRQGVITDWHDRKIGAGREWEGEIHEHLNTAHIILLLVSADFLASDYCYDIEMNRAMERYRTGEARVIPIILRSVDWQEAPFGKLQALPRDVRPVTKWEDRDEAFTNIARGIKKVVEDLNQRT
ncbi:MAG: TIR domain-containing protein [Candidatus Poribacteria bacterium]|nr:TIR domain-containing protein [Candidatus Poribacteria bacterium]